MQIPAVGGRHREVRSSALITEPKADIACPDERGHLNKMTPPDFWPDYKKAALYFDRCQPPVSSISIAQDRGSASGVSGCTTNPNPTSLGLHACRQQRPQCYTVTNQCKSLHGHTILLDFSSPRASHGPCKLSHRIPNADMLCECGRRSRASIDDMLSRSHASCLESRDSPCTRPYGTCPRSPC